MLPCLVAAACQAAPTPTPAPTVAPTPAPTATPAPVPCGSLQSRITAAPAGSTLNLTGCGFTGGATVSKPLTILGGTITTAAGRSGLLITSSGVTVSGVRIVGPQSSTFNSDEVGIEVQGTTSSPIDGLVIKGCDIGNLGYGGMYIRHVTNFVIEANTVHDGVYAGIMVLSGRVGTIAANTVSRIGVRGADANGNNAYGIALSRGESDLATDPRSSDVTVSTNTVEDVPTWHAYDTHGGQRISWTGNIARGSRSGIFVTGSNSPGGMVRSLDNDVNGNTFYAMTGADHYAVTSVYSTGGYVRGNTIAAWPSGHAILTTSSGDTAATAVSLTVTNNAVTP